MEDFGETLGLLIIIFYSLAMANFVLKFILKNFKNILKKNETFFSIYKKVVRFFMKYHRWFGIITILFIGAHFYTMITYEHVKISGLIAAGLMLLQITLGAALQYLKPKTKFVLWFHRIIAFSILIAVLIHVN